MAERLKTTVTWLEMHADPHLHVPHPAGKLSLLRVEKPPVHFYRYLYETIGRNYHWVERRRMSDEELSAILSDEAVELYVLYSDGAPAGYAELDFRKFPETELAYFGLVPDFTGMGLGKFLLAQAIEIAWDRQIERLIVHTCTLDHPGALPLYQKYGFIPFAQEEEEIETLD